MSKPRRDLCSKCTHAPTCSDRGTPAKPVHSCDSFEVYADLCTTCNDSATCHSRGTSLRPVFYCEEFDAYVPVAAPEVRSAAVPVDPRDYRGIGLCADCEEREHCIVPRPEGGVWNCEGYQ